VGVRQVTATGTQLVGPGKLIDPARVARMWVSPRKRAQQTFRILFSGGDHGSDIADKVTLTEDITEWDYGDYEGLVVREIRAWRKEKGLDRERDWSIWRDGCESGEYIYPCSVRVGFG
jgi:sedoheptulose-bisphosphatase